MASFAPTLLTLTLPLTLTAALLTPGDARAADPPVMMKPTNQLVDGRRALPLFPTTSWKDGFFLEHSAIADIGFLPYIEYLMGTPGKALFAGYPAVQAWWTRCSERPSWRKAAGRA